MVVPKIPERYRKAKRAALESWLVGKVTIFNDVEIVNEKTHLSEFKKLALYIDEPCRINYQKSVVTTDNEPSKLQRNINVRLKPELKVPAGSVFRITQCDFEGVYKQSGDPQHYIDHQIIPLVRERLA